MRVLKIIGLLAVLAGAGYGGKVLYESDLLALKRVEVIGNSRLSANEVVAASELKEGNHLLKLSTTDVAKAVEEVPWVHRARVERILPSKVRITVEEREPVALVIVGGESFIVDADGLVLAIGDESFVRITDLPLTSLKPGGDIDLRQFQHSLEIFKGLPASVRVQVKSIRAASVDRITLELSNGTSILYGAAEMLDDKNYAVEKLISETKVPLASIDVRVPNRPAVRPR